MVGVIEDVAEVAVGPRESKGYTSALRDDSGVPSRVGGRWTTRYCGQDNASAVHRQGPHGLQSVRRHASRLRFQRWDCLDVRWRDPSMTEGFELASAATTKRCSFGRTSNAEAHCRSEITRPATVERVRRQGVADCIGPTLATVRVWESARLSPGCERPNPQTRQLAQHGGD